MMNNLNYTAMNKIIKWLLTTLIASLMLATASCSVEEMKPVTEKQTCKMTLTGDIQGYNDTKSEDSKTWVKGDKIFLHFNTTNGSFSGEAIYGEDNTWTVSYTGTFEEGENLNCSAYYFVNAEYSEINTITLKPQTEIYEDTDAFYTYMDNTLSVQVSLTPKTARIRFTGTEYESIYVTGITTYSSFAIDNHSFYSTATPIKVSVDQSGSTPYIYGHYTDKNYRHIGVITSTDAFSRECPAEMLSPAKSGYMKIPTLEEHPNWKNHLCLKTNDVEFKMVAVSGHSSGFFMIAETEVTEQLYDAIYNNKKSSSQLPVSNLSLTFQDISVITDFLTKLNNITSLNFYIPTEEQWLYASTGGDKSKGYIYPGSDILEEVAWISSNSSGVKHNVKEKKPNELGIYDMYGNIGEFHYITRFSTSVYNYYDYRLYCYGGTYNDTSISSHYSYDEIGTSSSPDFNTEDIGFRIALTLE